MTKSEIVTYFLQLMDDPFGGYYTTTFTDLAANLAQEEVQKHLLMAGELYYVKQVQASTVQNQQDYIWPQDLLKLNRVEIITSGVTPNQIIQEITPITLNQMGAFSQTTGTPSNYCLKQDRFSLYPIPDSIWTLNLYYSYKIAALTSNSQTPDIPEIYHKVISAYMARMGKVKADTDMTNVNMLIMPFEKEMDELAQQRQYQTPRRVIETDVCYGTGY